MEQLPMLPGYTFRDPTKTKHHLSHAFNFINGYRVPLTNPLILGPGKYPKDVDSVRYYESIDPGRYDPSLTYGRVKSYPFKQFKPHYAEYDGKCLCFRAFFKQSVHESPDEHYRVRKVNIIYHLEDDTISVIEAPVDVRPVKISFEEYIDNCESALGINSYNILAIQNAGFSQGRIVRRGKILKDDGGSFYHWKDFSVGIDVSFHCVVYHIVDTDVFTREFMQSQGIEMGPPEEMPIDPYTQKRSDQRPILTTKTPFVDDKLRRFLEYDRKILRFYAVSESEIECEGKREYIIHYYLADDCVEISEVYKKNDGRDPFPLLLRKVKVPKNWKDVPLTHQPIYREVTDGEVEEYYGPKDFLVGQTIFIFSRRFFIYDCDLYTRNYYQECLSINQKPGIDVFEKKLPPPQQAHPPHTGIGAVEDTIQNCLRVIPKRPKKDVIRMLQNANKKLRYSAVMDCVHPEDSKRKFVISYSLSDGEIEISEPPLPNSGFMFKRFLRGTHISKPGSNMDDPELYTPIDFYIGAVVHVFEHRFIITGADLAVYRYIQANPDKFPEHVKNNIRNYMVENGYLKEEVDDETKINIKNQTKECIQAECCPEPAEIEYRENQDDYRPFGLKKFEDDCTPITYAE